MILRQNTETYVSLLYGTSVSIGRLHELMTEHENVYAHCAKCHFDCRRHLRSCFSGVESGMDQQLFQHSVSHHASWSTWTQELSHRLDWRRYS